MKRNRSTPGAAIIPELGYPDVSTAAAWPSRAFGPEAEWGGDLVATAAEDAT